MTQTKTEQLDNLFTEWEEKSKSNYKNKFIRDGIIDENLFTQARIKILFITKEANDPKQTVWDFRKLWWQNIKYAFSYRIAEWSFGLLNDFPYYDNIWKEDKAHNAIRNIAFMNIKKSGGKGRSDPTEMLEHLNNNFYFIQKEIDIISPDIIITGLSWKELRNDLFPNTKWDSSGSSVDVAKFKKSKVIDFYHPSSRIPPAATYCLLQNIVNSDIFKEL